MRPPLSPQAFVAQSRAAFLAGPSAGATASATVWVGNVAGDLDTIVSAVCAAYCRQVQGAEPASRQHVPLVPFPRPDFRLRQDACLLFRHCGFDFDSEGAVESLLYFPDEAAAPAEAWRGAGALSVALTDHNRLAEHFAASLGDVVVEVIDHHSDERAHLSSSGGARLIDTSAGASASPPGRTEAWREGREWREAQLCLP